MNSLQGGKESVQADSAVQTVYRGAMGFRGGANKAGSNAKGGGGKGKVKAPSKTNCLGCKLTTNVQQGPVQ